MHNYYVGLHAGEFAIYVCSLYAYGTRQTDRNSSQEHLLITRLTSKTNVMPVCAVTPCVLIVSHMRTCFRAAKFSYTGRCCSLPTSITISISISVSTGLVSDHDHFLQRFSLHGVADLEAHNNLYLYCEIEASATSKRESQLNIATKTELRCLIPLSPAERLDVVSGVNLLMRIQQRGHRGHRITIDEAINTPGRL